MVKKEIERVIFILNQNNIFLKDGMTDAQIQKAEEHYQITFPIELKSLLMSVLPVSASFYDWTDYSEENKKYINRALNWPIEGILFDVEHNSFWIENYWESKPESLEERLKIAEQQVRKMPKLIPIYSHRYIPCLTNQELAPILSVYQTDIIYYGTNLWHYFEHEFGLVDYPSIDFDNITPVPCWSELG